MANHPAITISRSFGSGGTEIGFLVARSLGWQFCDRRILRLAAVAMGHSVASINHHENRHTGFKDWLMTIFSLGSPETPFTPLREMPVYSTELFEVQSEVIRQMVDHAPSVIVGRGGFIALKGRPDTLHVSIHADLDFRVRSLVERKKVGSEKAAREAIAISDKGRAAFVRAISGADWRDPRHFDLVLDTGDEGFEGTAEHILREARAKFGACLVQTPD